MNGRAAGASIGNTVTSCDLLRQIIPYRRPVPLDLVKGQAQQLFLAID